METMQHLFADVKSGSFSLNYSGTRKLQIYVNSALPRVECIFKIIATDHSCHVEFSKDTWNDIVRRSEDIIETMESEHEVEIFNNGELKVFTEERYNQCAICFVDQRGQRVNMMISSFKKMMSHSSSISTSYEKLPKDIKKIAEGMRIFVDSLVTKYNQCNVRSTAFKNHLLCLQTGIRELCSLPNFPSLEIDYNDYDSDDEDYRRGRKRRNRW